MPEKVFRLPSEPTIVAKGFVARKLKPNPSEFGRLARKVGIPESEITKVCVTLVPRSWMPLGVRGEYSHSTKGVTVGIPRWRSNRSQIIHIAAHELDHFNYFLKNQPDVTKIKLETRGEKIKNLLLNIGIFLPGVQVWALILKHRRFEEYLSRDQEVHARATVGKIMRTGEQFNLLTVADNSRRRRFAFWIRN